MTDVLSTYKLCAVSKAAGIFSNRKQSIKRGRSVKDPVGGIEEPIVDGA